MPQLRVLVVDDSRAFRTILAGAVDASGCARVVAHAVDGRDAVAKAAEFQPDVVTLDVEMPVMNGLEALEALRARHPKLKAIMVSAHTRAGAQLTIRALALGAHDFVEKPEGGDLAANKELLRSRLAELLRPLAAPPAPLPERVQGPSLTPTGLRLPRFAAPDVVAIGASTGGPKALVEIIPRLLATFPLPVVLVQHMPPLFTTELAQTLTEKGKLPVKEAVHGQPLAAGTVYLAPGGKHLRVASTGGTERHLELTEDPPEHFCRPAVDYLFRSVAAVYRERALGVILTGMGKDGTAGLKEMKRHGVKVVGQSAASCTVYGMPREAMAAGVVDVELPAEQIADEIAASLSGSTARRG